VNSAELYDPDTASWTAIANMHADRGEITATQLADGKVLVYGGRNRSNSEEPFSAELYDPATGVWTDAGDLASPDATYSTATRLLDGSVLLSGDSRDAERYDPRTGTWTAVGSMLRQHGDFPATLLLDGTVLVAGGSDCLDDRCVASGAAELYVPAGVSLPPLPAFPSPAPPVFPSPTPVPTPFPPAAGPVPPNARTWTVTVVNNSSNPTTLFVADETERGTLGRLVGSVTPNVVPPGSTVEVTFTLPAKGVEGWAIFVNPRPDDGSLVGAAEIGMPGKILDEGGPNQTGWVSP
jgi:Kelch motif protein